MDYGVKTEDLIWSRLGRKYGLTLIDYTQDILLSFRNRLVFIRYYCEIQR